MLMLTTSVLTEGLLMVDDHFFVVIHFTEVPDINPLMPELNPPAPDHFSGRSAI